MERVCMCGTSCFILGVICTVFLEVLVYSFRG